MAKKQKVDTVEKNVKGKTGPKTVRSYKQDVVYSAGRIWTTQKLKDYRKYQAKYVKSKYRTFVVRFNYEEEAKLINFLQSQDNLTETVRYALNKTYKLD